MIKPPWISHGESCAQSVPVQLWMQNHGSMWHCNNVQCLPCKMHWLQKESMVKINVTRGSYMDSSACPSCTQHALQRLHNQDIIGIFCWQAIVSTEQSEQLLVQVKEQECQQTETQEFHLAFSNANASHDDLFAI